MADHFPTAHSPGLSTPGYASCGPIGVFGGTFDPIHFAHLRLAEELADVFGFAEVRFVPAALPPHRAAPGASAEHRRAMVALAIDGNPRFRLDARELKREGASYTYDTLSEMRAELGERPLCLLMGADAFVAFMTWHRWAEIFDLAHLVVARRPGYPLEQLAASLPGPLKSAYLKRHLPDPNTLPLEPAGRIFTHELTGLDVSATGLRALIARRGSLRYLMPDAVIAYIESHGLYRERNAR
ncbi:MAG TPA: nicotinate-nucleotide adenylyltransferase [Burkholderiales bacterium]|nr:nicotinate-nucleotide adenylyltransferase [Burkholderiales bacterium]